MKIICKKGCSLKSALQIMSEYIEKKGLEYPLISGDLEIEISLKKCTPHSRYFSDELGVQKI